MCLSSYRLVCVMPCKRQYVKADRRAIYGNDPDKWAGQITNYINRQIRKGQDVTVYAVDGDPLTITRDTAGKARFRNRVRLADGTYRLMTDAEYAVKLRAQAHIDELAEVSKRGDKTVPDRKKHSFARDGFNYRTAYFMDDTGYYRLTISVGKNGSINTIYNVGKIEEAEFPMSGRTAEGAQRPNETKSQENSASADSIAQNGTAVKDSVRKSSAEDAQQPGLTRSYRRADLSQEAQRALRKHKEQLHAVDVMAKKYGRKVVLVDTLEGKTISGTKITEAVNGAYDGKTGTIYIAADAQDGAFAYVAMHELVHSIKAESAEGYAALEQAVFDALENTGEDVQALVQYQMDKFGYSEEAAREEVVANTAPTVLTDEQFVQDLYNSERSLFERIRAFIADLLETFRELTQSGSWKQDAALARDVEAVRKIAEAFDAAAGEIAKRSTESTAKKSRLDPDFANRVNTEANIREVARMESVESLRGDEFKMGVKGELVKAVSEYFNSIGNKVENHEIGSVWLGKSGVKSDVGHGLGPDKTAAFKAVPAVIEQGKVVDIKYNWKKRGYDTVVIAAPVDIHAERYYMGVVAMKSSDSDRFYAHEVWGIKKNGASAFWTGLPAESQVGTGAGAPSINSILQRIASVNIAEYGKNIHELLSQRREVPQVIRSDVSPENSVAEDNVAVNETEVQQRNEFSDKNLQFSVRDQFVEDYNRWVEGGRDDNAIIAVGTTPMVFQDLGAREKKTVMQGASIKHSMKHLEMTDDFMKKVPYALENPIIVLKSRIAPNTEKPGDRPSTVVVYGDLADDHGNPVLMAINMKFTTPGQPTEVEDVQLIKNAYVKDHGLKGQIENSDVLYLNEDKERTNKWLVDRRLQLPLISAHYGSIGSIAETDDEVKITGVPYKELVGGIKFSVKDVTPEDTQRLEKENARLKAALENARAQVRLTGGNQVSAQAVEKLARKIVRDTHSRYDAAALAGDLGQIYTYAATAENSEEALREIDDVGIGLAKKVLRQSEQMDTTVSDQLTGLKDYLRNTGLSLNEDQKAEAAAMYGSYNDFRRQMFGTIKLTRDGVPLDVAWGELHDAYPCLFDADGTDMLESLVHAAELTRPQLVNPYGYNLDEAAADLWLTMQQEYANLPVNRTYADRQKARLDALRAEQAENLRRMRQEAKDRYEERLKAVKAENRAKRAELSEQYKKAVEDVKTAERMAEGRLRAKERQKAQEQLQAAKQRAKELARQHQLLANEKLAQQQARSDTRISALEAQVRELKQLVKDERVAGRCRECTDQCMVLCELF